MYIKKAEIQRFQKWLFCSIFFVVTFCPSTAEAQEVIPTYSDYLTDNLFLLHPSLAGGATRNQIRLTARQQWFDVDDAPGLQTLSINGRLGRKEGLGTIIFNDHNGNFSKMGAYLAYAYHLRLSAKDNQLHRLSFGLSAGLIQHRLDRSSFSQIDPALDDEKSSEIYPNMDAGVSYFLQDFYAHFTAKNLLPVQRELFNSEGIPVNQRRYFLNTGYIFSPRYNWFIEPSVMLQVGEAVGDKSADLNLKTYRNFNFGQVWAGVSYRQGLDKVEDNRENLRYVTPFAGVEYQNFIFGYTYSQQFNELVLSNSGFHQLTLGYNFGPPKERYHCGCPAIN